MRFQSIAFVAGVLIFISTLGSTFAGELQYQGCKLTTDSKGIITSMLYTDPTTYLHIEKEFLFTINPDGTPAKCTITFNDGIQRDMNHGEMDLKFAECGGPNTVWDYCKEQGKVVTYNLDSDKLPPFGKTSRVTLRSGWKYIGRLVKLADRPDGMSLVIEGAAGGPIPFYNNTVSTVEQMK
jgi:hypothetical protein